MIRSTALACLLAAAANAQSTYVLQGGRTAMNMASNWAQASPFAATEAGKPQYTMFGQVDNTIVTQVSGGDMIDIGGSIQLSGNTVIQLGGAGTSATNPAVLMFGSGNGLPSARTSPATFGPPATAGSPTSPTFDWNCNLNWLVGASIPATPPCSTSMVQLPTVDARYTTTYNMASSAQSIMAAGSTMSYTTCPATGDSFMVGPAASVNLGGCTSNFGFGSGQCASPGVSMSCAPNNVQYGVVRGQISAIATIGAGSNVTMITGGAYAGQAFTLSPDGMSLLNVTEAMGPVTVITPATATSNGVYKIQNTTFDGTTGTIEGDRPSSSASGSDGAVSGNALLVIIIVVLLVVAVVVFALVVMKKNKNEGSSEAASPGGTAFENPLYDESSTDGPEDVPSGDGLYADGNTGGYMDVPAGGETDAGYMDVPAESSAAVYDDDAGALYDEATPEQDATGGYMDVNADGNEDDDDDF
eukprot:m.52363 g.52363  ORF g.52363 m.52363 type:complete len:472 (+) comp7365_c0_seq2:55-1470(+)